MYRVIKKDTVEPRYFYFCPMPWVENDDGYICIWETDEEKASLFATKQEAIEALWRCGLCSFDVVVEEV